MVHIKQLQSISEYLFRSVSNEHMILS